MLILKSVVDFVDIIIIFRFTYIIGILPYFLCSAIRVCYTHRCALLPLPQKIAVKKLEKLKACV